LLVGPPGVLVLDSKNWKNPRIEHGRLWNGDCSEDEQVDRLRDQADSVAVALGDLGLAPAAVLPYLVLAGRKQASVEIRGVEVVGERSVQAELVRLPQRLTPLDVSSLVAALDERCPPAAASQPERSRRVVAPHGPAILPQRTKAAPEQIELAHEDRGIWDSVLETATREPIESWMTWLHPTQAQLTTRSYSGPARVRGPAGTGKTVVALHRARQLALRPAARILMTSFVGTLPDVHRALFERLAPAHAGSVEFLGIHKWAVRLLRQRNINVTLRTTTDARRVFSETWMNVSRETALADSVLPEDYWWTEIETVIKGRGLTDVSDYLDLTRVGRRSPLREEQRLAVWKIYEAYQSRLDATGLCDWPDVLQRALDSLAARPLERPYTSVIVDEVQDLTCIGLKLAHALVGDTPDGLFLVGDGQQSIYPGGFTLAESGVSVTGRATVLTRNYRNGSEILRTALDVVSGDQFDDLESDPEPGARAVDVDREGGQVKRCIGSTPASQRAALVSDLQWTISTDTRAGDVALLVRSNAEAVAWTKYLDDAGIPSLLLANYDGRSSNAIKVGTYQRAKGLEFSCVFLPDHDRAVSAQRERETDDDYRERAELQRRQLFVAMTRARDRLWLGSTR
jgi:superfamily I DNA/RNA helicase